MTEQLPEQQPEVKKLTIAELISICQGILTPEDVRDLEEMRLDEAIGHLRFILPDYGYDPEEFLLSIGIIELYKPTNNAPPSSRK